MEYLLLSLHNLGAGLLDISLSPPALSSMPHSLCVNFSVEFQLGAAVLLASPEREYYQVFFVCCCFKRQINLFKNATYKNSCLNSVFGDAGLVADEKLLMRGGMVCNKNFNSSIVCLR